MRNLNKARKEASLHREKKGRSLYRGLLQPRNTGSEQRGQKRRKGLAEAGRVKCRSVVAPREKNELGRALAAQVPMNSIFLYQPTVL